MKHSIILALTMLMLFTTTAWADKVVLTAPSTSVSSHSDNDNIVTITCSNGTGIQQGSSSYKITYDGTDYVPMKLSVSRDFTLTYAEGVTITSVTLLAMSNSDQSTPTVGAGNGDYSSLGTLPARNRNGNAQTIDITDVAGLRGSAQFLAIIVVEYTTAPANVAVTGITLSGSTATLTVGGEVLTLSPTFTPDNATNQTVTWTSSDPTVVTVADGVVTAVAVGTATITATATNGTDETTDDFSATCTVTVRPAGYYVILAGDTEDAENWTISDGTHSADGVTGLWGLNGTETITVTYNGTKTVKSVTAVNQQ
ncbi:MAG: Ig domain-containing protein [Bacteroidales bacterium]|nr:Ig domain-containing protein [Bacteroidales bacterium]